MFNSCTLLERYAVSKWLVSNNILKKFLSRRWTCTSVPLVFWSALYENKHFLKIPIYSANAWLCFEGVGIVWICVPRWIRITRIVIRISDRQVWPTCPVYPVPCLDPRATARRRSVWCKAWQIHRLAGPCHSVKCLWTLNEVCVHVLLILFLISVAIFGQTV